MHGMTVARLARLAGAMCAAVALMAVGSAAASAHVVKTKEPFTITYAWASITTEGEVMCTGYHETNSKKFPGNATEGGRDRETCVDTSGGAFTGLKGLEEGNTFPGNPPGYESDWFYLKGIQIDSIKNHFKVSRNDRKFRQIVYIPLEGKYPPIAESL